MLVIDNYIEGLGCVLMHVYNLQYIVYYNFRMRIFNIALPVIETYITIDY